MKKSISIWSFPGDWNLVQKLQLAKEAGFAGFELDTTETGPVNLSITESELHEIRRTAEGLGIELSGLATGLYWGANAASADPAIRKKAAGILEHQIKTASALGIDAVLVVPGAVGVDFVPGSEVVPYDAAWERSLQFVRDALPLAEKLKVTLCIENVWNKFLLSPLEMRSFIDGFSSEFVAAYLDVGNILALGYPEHWINILGSRVRRVHFKDYRRNVGSIDGFCDLLAGDVNWPEVRGALRKIGYEGWVAAEMIPPVPFYKFCPSVLIHNTSRAMDAIFAL
jgi:hexulose-6-phosphate isomerase